MKFGINGIASIATTALLLLGCGEPGDGGAATVDEPIINGTVTSLRNEIGGLKGPIGFCTATLIAPRWVLTAAHCVGFSTNNPGSYFFMPSRGSQLPSGQGIPVQQIFNFGPSGFTGGDIDAWARTHLHVTTDSSGNDDIALLLLTISIPSFLVNPAAVANSLPPNGATATDFGFGCYSTSGAQDGQKRFASWPFGNHSGALRGTNGFVINADGQLVAQSGFVPDPGFVTGGHLCFGDSGGPVVGASVNDNGAIWGVNSSSGAGIDTFGAVSFLQKPICQKTYATEPHNICVQGPPLLIPPVGCEANQSLADVFNYTDTAIRAVCGPPTNDTFCCNENGGWWDQICVNEAFNFGFIPRCSGQ